jgi:phage terminase large subunit-like protein
MPSLEARLSELERGRGWPEARDVARYRWRGGLARPEQLPPSGDWRTWLVLAGRGFGKTRSGAEWVREQIELFGARRVALVAPTAADARDVMVEGESGILAVCPPWNRPKYEPSKRRVTWPSGAVATCYSADEPERLRGPQHDRAWCDELGSWRRPGAYDNLLLGLRIGADPRLCVTTTPRPTRLLKSLLAAPTTVKTGGSTYANAANLAPAFLDSIVARFEGTRLGQQELWAELVEAAEGAWFPQFDPGLHVGEAAEYHPGPMVRLAIDAGTSRHTGAVLFQVAEDGPHRHRINVFGDYYAEGLYSAANAEAIKASGAALIGRPPDLVRLDPAATQRTGIGPAAYGEYERVFGARTLAGWPLRPVADGLDLIDVLLGGAGKTPEILIHPRCTHLISAFQGYSRQERAGEFLDVPEDPQHPHEELMDSLRGGLVDAFPEGRGPKPKFRRTHVRNLL